MTRLYRFLILITALSWLAVLTVAVSAEDITRPTYTWQKPSRSITFNAITNNPNFGDERDFLRVRPLESNTYSDVLSVHDGQEVVVMAYYDNDAASNYNLKSKNTRLKISIPALSEKSLSLSGDLMSDNAKPNIISDTTRLNAEAPFSLKYEKGSAQIWNNFMRGAKLSDEIIGSGVQLGTTKLDGVVQGGARYSGYVTLRAKVQVAKTSASSGSVGVVSGVPNTGPGDIAAIFGGVTALGAVAHRINAARRR